MSLNMLDKLSAQDVLEKIAHEEVVIPEFAENKNEILLLNLIRKIMPAYVEKYVDLPQGLLECTATTYLKIGACQELAQRFIVEWVLRNQSNNMVSLIFLAGDLPNQQKHTFILIGKVNCDDELIIGRRDDAVYSAPKKAHIGLADFIKNQPGDLVYVDPLLGEAEFLCFRNSEKNQFTEYCKKHKFTHVFGVRQMNALINRKDKVEFIVKLRTAAKEIAALTHEQLVITILNYIYHSILNENQQSWVMNKSNNTFCLKGEESQLILLKDFFISNNYNFGVNGDVDIIESSINREKMLVFRNASQLDLHKLYNVFKEHQHSMLKDSLSNRLSPT